MSTAFTLHVIRAQDVLVSPTLTLLNAQGVREAITEWIADASQRQLTFDKIAYHDSQRVDSSAVDAADLENMLAEFVPRPPKGEIARDLGLILCLNWKIRDQLNGLMFDYKGSDSLLYTHFDSGDTFRRACALFLEPLNSAGGDDNETISRVALHELGHVFNLQHDPSGRSFMATPDPGMNYTLCDSTAMALAGAGKSPEAHDHLPGLSNFGAANAQLVRLPRRKSRVKGQLREGTPRPKLVLEVKIAKGRYLLGEILTLEMHLKTVGSDVKVPCQLDPAYDRLRVWYETPLGERLLYRPFLRMCPSSRNSGTVASDKPLINNPRVSVGNQGVVFRRPGRYRIWAEFFLPGVEKPFISNVEEFNVYAPRNDQERELCSTLIRPDAARFLALKGGPLSRTSRDKLSELARKHPAHDATKHVRYALASQLLFRANRREQAHDLLKGLRFRLPSLQAGLERLRAAILKKP